MKSGIGSSSLRKMLPALLLAAILVTAVAPGITAAADQIFRPVVRGMNGVAVGGHPLTTAAGIRIMSQGGTAMDAAAAMILSASVIENQHFTFGGQSPILVYPANKGEVFAINGIGTAPGLATLDFFMDQGGIPDGILDGTIPPMPGAIVTLLDQFGTMSFEAVVQPALEYADGFPLGEYCRNYFIAREEAGRIKEQTAINLMKPGGKLPGAGEIFHQKDLARTIRTLIQAERDNAGKGRHAALMAVKDEFYKGPIAEEIVRYHKENGGLHRMEDYAKFETKVVPAYKTTYRGDYEINKHGPWTQGPVLLQMLNILEGYDLKAMGHNSADYLHVVTEAMKLAMADRDHYYGDPDFSDPPMEGLISKEYAAERRKMIDMGKANMEEQLQGDPFKFQKKKSARLQPRGLPEGFQLIHPGGRQGTTCINVADKWGNIVAATPSGVTGWTTPVMGNTGILMNARMGQFVLDDTVNPYNVVGPGKRPRTTLTPTIVLRDGKAYMSLSTPGTERQDQSILQVILNIVEFGMNPQEAVEAARVETLHVNQSGRTALNKKGVLQVEGRVAAEVVEELKKRGHIIDPLDDYGMNSGVTVAMFDTKDRTLAGGADVRRDRYGMAW